jgi:chromate transporter
MSHAHLQQSPWTIFLVFLRLGLTSFGGPVAHLAFFRDEFVARQQWLDEQSYVDLVALCQFLPGPSSSQVGIALGLLRAGWRGAFAAWAGFTLPSAIALVLFALGLSNYHQLVDSSALQGLKIVALAVVAHAVWNMARVLCPDLPRIGIMLAACAAALILPGIYSQLGAIACAAIVATIIFKPDTREPRDASPAVTGQRPAVYCLLAFGALLCVLPLLAQTLSSTSLHMVDAFYRTGSLVFGGGHVVLPLLQAEVVPTGWVSEDVFIAGYGATQAVPGPLFTFSAFLGASMQQAPSGWIGATICLLAIYLPSFLLVFGALPFWRQLRNNARMQAMLMGVNAAVVGLLLAALYQPVGTSAIHSPGDVLLALLALLALVLWKVPVWLLVPLGAAVSWAIR